MMTSSIAEQLLFDFPVPPTFNDLDFFVTTTNYQAISWIKNWPQWPGPVMAIYGPSGCGKTHLGRVWQKKTLAYEITKETLSSPEKFQALLQKETSCYLIDDMAFPLPEEQLFHFYNKVFREKRFLLLLSSLSPAQWEVELPDLKSRLKAVPAVGIDLPDDNLLEAVLTKLFSDKQIRVSGDLVSSMIKKIDRSFEAAIEMVETLDRLSLKNQKAITPLLLREALSCIEEKNSLKTKF